MHIERTAIDRIRVSFEGTVDEMQSMGETLRLLVDSAESEKRTVFIGKYGKNIQKLFSAFAVTPTQKKEETLRDKVLALFEKQPPNTEYQASYVADALCVKEKDVVELLKDLAEEGILNQGTWSTGWVTYQNKRNQLKERRRNKILNYIEQAKNMLFTPHVTAKHLALQEQDVVEILKDLTQEGILKESVFTGLEGFFGYTWIPPEERENVRNQLPEHNGQQCGKG